MFLLEVDQTEMAERLGVQQPLISQWLNGTRNPNDESIRRIAKALKVKKSILTDEDLWTRIRKMVK